MLRIGYLHLRSITPTSLGTYSPRFSDKLFRITELRGKARWWLRAIVSDIVGFDKKIILEIQSKIFGGNGLSSLLQLRATRPYITRCLDEVVKGARVGWSGGRYVPQVAWHPRLSLIFMKKLKKVRKILKRLLIKREASGSPPHEKLWELLKKFIGEPIDHMFKKYRISTKIFVASRTTRKNLWIRVLLGLYSIALSLFLSGLGKGSRRGLGAMSITFDFLPLRRSHLWPLLDDYIKQKLGLLEKISQDVEKTDLKTISTSIRELYYTARELTVMITGGYRGSAVGIPEIYSLSPSSFTSYLMATDSLMKPIGEYGSVYFEAFEATVTLSNILFNRTTFHPQARAILGRYGLKTLPHVLQDIEDNAVGRLGSYILGLPRQGKIQKNKTQYLYIMNRIDDEYTVKPLKKIGDEELEGLTGFRPLDADRRASPVIVSMLNDKVISITIIKSKDYPHQIAWGTTKKRKKLDTLSIEKAFQIIEEYLYNLTKKLGGETIRVLGQG